jgi:hypothetical protein
LSVFKKENKPEKPLWRNSSVLCALTQITQSLVHTPLDEPNPRPTIRVQTQSWRIQLRRSILTRSSTACWKVSWHAALS